MNVDWEYKAAKKIIFSLKDRKGVDFDNINEDIMEEIINKITQIIKVEQDAEMSETEKRLDAYLKEHWK